MPNDEISDKQLIKLAEKVLALNNKGKFTSPAGAMYPHQWFWDSCFISIGLRHQNVNRAQQELTSLLRGQWTNGMFPNIIFSNDIAYSQDRNTWRSNLSISAPTNVATSGITQPPMLAEAVFRVGQKLSKAERKTWYKKMLPSLVNYHSWLYRDRNPGDDGLIVLFHPYESGMDSTPPWLDQLHKHHRPWWANVVEKSHLVNLVNYFRRDTRHAPPGQRMSNLDALLYFDVIRKLRTKNYESKEILKRSSFTVIDVSFNSIFVRANTLLLEMAKQSNYSIPDKLLENIKKSQLSFEQLWDSYSEQYYSKNYKTKKLIRVPSIGTLMPLYSGAISQERAEKLVKLLKDKKFFDADFPVPSVPLQAKEFSEHRYWQGPTWINTNWLIVDGLNRYGFKEEAKKIEQASVELVRKSGFYEYFSALDGSPAGAENFSWTAALILDALQK